MNIRPRVLEDYAQTLSRMQKHVQSQSFENEIWLVEHPPVYTIGRAGDPKHLLTSTNIPLIQSDRGGQITYHGPGQLIAYTMVDVKPFNLQPLELVTALETATVLFLKSLSVMANNCLERRGVYTQGKKIASIGLKMKKNRSYHGIALNVDTNLNAFNNINPCGYDDLEMTNLTNHCKVSIETVAHTWPSFICKQLEKQTT